MAASKVTSSLRGLAGSLRGLAGSLRGPAGSLRGPAGGGDGRTYGRTDGRTDGTKSPVLQDIVPFGAAAQKEEKEKELDAQRQYMVIGTLALLLIFLFFAFLHFWAAVPKGTMSCRTKGDFRSFVCLFVCSYVPPPAWRLRS